MNISVPNSLHSLPICLMVMLTVISATIADAQQRNAPTGDLKELRAMYAQAVADAATVPRPKAGDSEFGKKLSAWSKANSERTHVVHELVPALFEAWKTLPDDSKDCAVLEKEIRTVHKNFLKPSESEKNHKASQFFAGIIWKFVEVPGLSKERATFLAALTIPHAGVRRNDNLASQGRPTEPYGWDIQMTHTMVLLRAGKIDDARKENTALLTKLNVNLSRGRLPNLNVNFRGGKRSQASLKRECLLQRSLIEATASVADAAKSFLKEANEIEETESVRADQKSLLQEIKSAIQK